MLLAKQLATLDLLSEGRLVVQPTVSWHRAEYEALGVAFEERGELLDEHLAAWRVLWRESPASFEARHYRFADVSLEPKPFRPSRVRRCGSAARRCTNASCAAWSSTGVGSTRSERRATTISSVCVRRWRPSAGTSTELEMVGGTRGRFADADGVADLGEALASIPAQLERGFTTICIKPSQFIDDPDEIGRFCRDVVERVAALVR